MKHHLIETHEHNFVIHNFVLVTSVILTKYIITDSLDPVEHYSLYRIKLYGGGAQGSTWQIQNFF